MRQCVVCGNEYDKCFDVVAGGETYTFDCLECAIHQLAPTCPHCNCRVIGHGVEVDGEVFCCAHCVRMSGETGIVDRQG
jgi:hypothetical protein